MLNAEFRWLDPEMEQLERWRNLAGIFANSTTPEQSWEQISPDWQKNLAHLAAEKMGVLGVIKPAAIRQILRQLAREHGLYVPECGFFGWNETFWEHLLSRFNEPVTLVIGILDGEGIWAGAIAGVTAGNLDFIATPHYFWNDEPEMAAKQALPDLAPFCHKIEKKFSRPVQGIFIYRDEFAEWRDKQWSGEIFDQFVRQQTAIKFGW